jgi:hypothetical protein
MKNAYQRRRVKARVEKRARMMKLDAITLEFARQVIEEETGAPLSIDAPSAPLDEKTAAGSDQARLIARDDKNNPLVSTFEWTRDAAQRILRVPAGFMRNKTQERIEELARSRTAATIDLPLVEEGIEIGKQMMSEMIASYSAPGASAAATTASPQAAPSAAAPGRGYLNEVGAQRLVPDRQASGEPR